MKKLLTLTALVTSMISSAALATSLNCYKTEFANNERTVSQVEVKLNDDPHGSIFMFKSDKFEDVSGFISLMNRNDRYFAVMSMYSEKTGVNSSAQYQMVENGQYAQLQIVMPSDSKYLAGIELVCEFIHEGL